MQQLSCSKTGGSIDGIKPRERLVQVPPARARTELTMCPSTCIAFFFPFLNSPVPPLRTTSLRFTHPFKNTVTAGTYGLHVPAHSLLIRCRLAAVAQCPQTKSITESNTKKTSCAGAILEKTQYIQEISFVGEFVVHVQPSSSLR